ncbi:hypothetical protein PCNPT3_09880 [Psychromonas sp. CNPT3]|uniref:EamA family transporter n=1 Tax=Psychromonas sp. CNPT3 TaxID=314282 RepID=UPI00006E9CE0|nr:EamA family transporter [Psychromonas sp. CNPT3]AGH81914.1 hypothetical protein PCNPT3_09880 [Psychromonas sp. CNPT3]
MSIFAILLIILSALLHASWNILSKSNKTSVHVFFFMASLCMALLLLPFLLWFYFSAGYEHFSPRFWYLIFFSGIFQIIYLMGLGLAYKNADVGVVYPIARALPVLIVGAFGFLLGDIILVKQWLGFLLITGGCILVPLISLRQFKLSHYLHVSIAWAVLAAIGTTGYSIIDKLALSELLLHLESQHTQAQIAIFYLGMQFWAATLPLGISFILTGNSHYFRQAWKIKKPAFLTGFMMAGTYGLVLYAMLLTTNVSLVVALRQVSIIFGLLLGFIFLKEKMYMPRIMGCLLMLLGLVIALSG